MSEVLVADIGGTNARFALAGGAVDVPRLEESTRVLATADFPSLEDAARHYLDEVGVRPARAVFAIAGPVIDDRIRMTNCPWVMSLTDTRRALALDRLRTVNDFHAMARSVPLLRAGDLEVLGAPPAPEWGAAPLPDRMCAVMGPGTGLGVAGLVVRHGRAHALETEGGHVGFAPVDALEIEVLRRLMARFGRVSTERIVCGSGLVALHRALDEIEGRPAEDLEPRDVTARAAGGDAAAVRTVETFCGIFGSVAGDAALMLGAFGGVYLPGGLVPHLLPWLREGRFRARFAAKGRFAEVLERTPTVAVLHPQPGLLGLAAIAADAA
ncbi:glucokinase [Coralloluteibacterium thermophilus]|uniref:Glucokinase n=1 Tax=Coralloluteibacterium thermophilum TaxID=2707049 RepID=A0ABV9NRY4_9GAMM